MPTSIIRVSASNQDCLVYKDWLANWQFDSAHVQVAVGFHAFTRYAQGAGLYFSPIGIPAGSRITSAKLVMTSNQVGLGLLTRSIIQMEDNVSPVPFTTLANYQARSRDIVLVHWMWDYSDWLKDKEYESPDLSLLVQRRVDSPGWTDAGPMVFFWNDHDDNSYHVPNEERNAYSYDSDPTKVVRLEITFIPPLPPPPPPVTHWAPLDVQEEKLPDGFTIVVYTDTPCHLWCRITKEKPLKHTLPSRRRGTFLQGEVNFCFVVYDDNEQEEAGDTLIHTFIKPSWPHCETRWCYFIGTIDSQPSNSTSAIFPYHFDRITPLEAPPFEMSFDNRPSNREVYYTHGVWMMARGTLTGIIHPWWADPPATMSAATTLTVSYFVRRAFLSFNTSTLPAGITIVGAKLDIFVVSWLNTSSATYPFLYLQPGEQSDPIVTSDYGAQRDIGLQLGIKRFDSLVAGQYCSITLNEAGIAHINPAGITKLCLRGQMDVIDRAPPLGSNSVVFHSYQKGVDHRPKLIVYYQKPPL